MSLSNTTRRLPSGATTSAGSPAPKPPGVTARLASPCLAAALLYRHSWPPPSAASQSGFKYSVAVTLRAGLESDRSVWRTARQTAVFMMQC